MLIIIRASSLPSYLDCQLRAAVSQLGHVFDLHGHQIARARGNVGAMIGSGVHGGAEVALKERMTAGTLAPVDVVEDAAIAAFRDRLDAEGGDDLVMDQDSPTVSDAERQVRRMVRQYRVDVAERANPLAVESRIEADVGDGVVLSGQADLLHLDEQRSGCAVRDLKTGRRRIAPTRHAAQCGSYSLLFRTLGFAPDHIQIDWLKRERLDKPQPDVEAQPLDVDDCERIAFATIGEFGAKARAFAADGDPARFLLNPSSHLCNPKYCRAYGSAVCAATRGASAHEND